MEYLMNKRATIGGLSSAVTHPVVTLRYTQLRGQ
jgi:hypothetical protein